MDSIKVKINMGEKCFSLFEKKISFIICLISGYHFSSRYFYTNK